MKIMRLSTLTIALVFTLLSSAAYAQFEGHITMSVYSEDDGKMENSTLNIYATQNRILVKGDDEVSVMGRVNAGGLLIRNDQKDFIILTDEKKALQTTKEGIESVVEMMFGWMQDGTEDPDTPETEYSFSNREKTILGQNTTEMIIERKDEPGKHLSVWLTPNIDINWGILAEPWKGMPKSIDKEINGMSQDVFFKGKNFPMLVEAVEGNERTKVMEVKNIDRSAVAKSRVEVPTDVTLVSLQEYIFSLMME